MPNPNGLTPGPQTGSYPAFGFDFFVNLNKPALEAMGEINGRFIEQMTAVNREWSKFFSHRLEQDMDFTRQLAECQGPQEVMQLYMSFMQSSMQEYQAEFALMARMGQTFTDETAGIMREKAENAARELKH